jgi:hypothetical protein
VVRGIVRSDIDTNKLARAFILLAEEQTRRDAAPPNDSDRADAV